MIVCAGKSFFFYLHRIVLYSFGINFLYILFGQILLPSGIIYAIFWFISKDSRNFKVKACFPLLASFYIVYLPYRVIAGGGSVYSAFELFLKPIMYLAFIAGVAEVVYQINKLLSSGCRSGKIFNIWCGTGAAVLILPAAVESAWLIGVFLPVWLVFWLLYTGAVVFWYIRSVRSRTGWLYELSE